VQFRQTEICDHYFGPCGVWGVEEEVFRLDVQVKNIVLMELLEATDEVPQKLGSIPLRKMAFNGVIPLFTSILIE